MNTLREKVLELSQKGKRSDDSDGFYELLPTDKELKMKFIPHHVEFIAHYMPVRKKSIVF